MNSELRRALYKKKMLHNKYIKYKSKQNRENCRKQRNFVTKLENSQSNCTFLSGVVVVQNPRIFGQPLNLILSSKASRNTTNLILMEKDNLISDQQEVCNVLNNFYVNIAKEIGTNNKSPDNAGSDPSIEGIKENSPPGSYINFEFKSTEQSKVLKVFQSLSSKKDTGRDQIPQKIIKSIISNKFPDRLKKAQTSPIFKKDDPFMKKNYIYRPVGICQHT